MFKAHKPRMIVVGVFLLVLGMIVACGESATPSPAPGVDTAELAALVQDAVNQAVAGAPTGATVEEIQALVQAAVAASQQTGVTAEDIEGLVAQAVGQAVEALPTAVPTPSPSPVGTVEPSGTLNTGMTVLGPPRYLLRNQDFSQSRFDDTVTHEDLWWTDSDGKILNRLVESWESSPDGKVFTLNFQKGVSFHGGWGEFNADDFIFTLNRVMAEGSIHTVSARVRDMYFCDGCVLEKLGTHSIKLTRPDPTVQLTWNNQGNLAFRSKLHLETVGEERADVESIGTGPWELVEAKDGQFKRVRAVEDHWRKTPNFSEMIWWEILEESTRLANFLVGRLDTGTFSPDSIQAIKQEARPDIKFMARPGGLEFNFIMHGQLYDVDSPFHLPDDEGNIARPLGFSYVENCLVLPYVSCSPDTESPEWEKARKVREAMSISIDREKLVNNLVFGDGRPIAHLYWTGHDGRLSQLGLEQLKFEYDPARARQLLSDAGYPSGIEFDLILTEASVAGPIVVGQAVATMWEDVGIQANQQTIPYTSWRPCTVARSCQAVSTHASNGVVEPLRISPIFWHPRSGINLAFEHPFFTDITDRSLRTVDDEERWALQGEAWKWIYDNVMNLPLFERLASWPLGPKLDPWPVQVVANALLGNWEFANHRQ